MKANDRRTYHSPLREALAAQTRDAILAGVSAWLQRSHAGELTLDAIAQEAGVERRTVLRHFATKELLLEAFWVWVNERVTPRTLPESLEELVAAPRETFAKFDDEEGVIRASLHTPAGRAMRLAVVAERRRAFAAALREVTRTCTAAERRRLTAVVHALYSASAWEAMRDYAGVTGAQAGDAATWALGVLVDAVRSGRVPATVSSHTNQP